MTGSNATAVKGSSPVLGFRSVILGVAVVVASAGPAWRAAAVDPASTLREE